MSFEISSAVCPPRMIPLARTSPARNVISPSRIAIIPSRKRLLRSSSSLLSELSFSLSEESFSLSAVSVTLNSPSFLLSASSVAFVLERFSFCAESSELVASSRSLPSLSRSDSARSSSCSPFSAIISSFDSRKFAFAFSNSDCARERFSVASSSSFSVKSIVWRNSSMPKSAVRTFSEISAIKPIDNPVIRQPVTTVTTIDVWRGRKPSIERRFLPIFVPSLSPINAIAPPVTIITNIK